MTDQEMVELENTFYRTVDLPIKNFLNWLHQKGWYMEGELPAYTSQEWMQEVAKGATRQGYWEWAQSVAWHELNRKD